MKKLLFIVYSLLFILNYKPLSASNMEPVRIYISSNTAGATNFIWNTNSLQSGATFYVSSGTVNTFNIGTSITWPDGTVQVSSPTAGGGPSLWTETNPQSAVYQYLIPTNPDRLMIDPSGTRTDDTTSELQVNGNGVAVFKSATTGGDIIIDPSCNINGANGFGCIGDANSDVVLMEGGLFVADPSQGNGGAATIYLYDPTISYNSDIFQDNTNYSLWLSPYSGRVMVNGGTDDLSSALQVNGATSLDGGHIYSDGYGNLYAYQFSTDPGDNTGNESFGYGAGATVNTPSGGGYNNSFFGDLAGGSTTTGNDNTANGYAALESNTTGNNNTASGFYALAANTTGSNNMASGYYALTANTTGNNNMANGYYALAANTTGNNNMANGNQALDKNTTGSYNTASGFYALYSNTSGGYNTASGYYALDKNTTGNNNTASGYYALAANTTGVDNTANGYQALTANTTGSNNTASGYYALAANTTGVDNTANGYQALTANTTGSNNMANGYYALAANTSGGYNTAVGYRAGNTSVSANANTMGGNNTFLGYNAGPGVPSANAISSSTCLGANCTVNTSNSLVLGAISGINSSPATTLVGIGTRAPSSLFDVEGGSVTIGGNNAALGVAGTITANSFVLNGVNVSTGAWIANTSTLQQGATFYVSSGTVAGPFTVNGSTAAFLNGNVGIGTSAPTTKLHISSGTVTIDGNVSPALTIKGSGAPPDSTPLCLLNGQLGHCTISLVTGTCVTCSVP